MKKILLSLFVLMGLGLSACTFNKPTTTTNTTDPQIVQPGDSSNTGTTEPTTSAEGGDPTSEPGTTSEPGSTSEPEEPTSDPTEPGGTSSEPGEGGEEVTPNDGTLEHPFTVSEGYAIAELLEANADAGAQYFTTGVVTGEISFYKGRLSFDFTDGEHTLRVYNMNNEENKASYKEGEINFKTGDTLIVAGTYKNYVKDDVSTLEICYVKDVANCYRAG